ncbi:unnamed protein product [Moneuplotes crassus]|uniref:Uncharacterized protein n=1 Tax=Euplotes crassus TaxID=5936 RepID=A0AAD1U5J9_EUPCR|nr:unnamed protein product [Moneuplotes crassus]
MSVYNEANIVVIKTPASASKALMTPTKKVPAERLNCSISPRCHKLPLRDSKVLGDISNSCINNEDPIELRKMYEKKIRNLNSSNEIKTALLQQKYDLKCKEIEDLKENNKYYSSINSICNTREEEAKEQLKVNREQFLKEMIDIKADHLDQMVKMQNKIYSLEKDNMGLEDEIEKLREERKNGNMQNAVQGLSEELRRALKDIEKMKDDKIRDNIRQSNQKEIDQLCSKIREMKNEHQRDQDYIKKYEKEIEDLKHLHDCILSELKKSHQNEREVLESRIQSLEHQIKGMINNHPITDCSFMMTESAENIETITDENYTLQSNRDGNFYAGDNSNKKDLSIIYESYKENQDKLENYLANIIPKKDYKISELERDLMNKEIIINKLKNELDKTKNNLKNMKTNVFDLKQRAKVLEDFLADHTSKQCDSFCNSRNNTNNSRVSHHSKASSENEPQDDHSQQMYEVQSNTIHNHCQREIPQNFVTPNKPDKERNYKSVFKSDIGLETMKRMSSLKIGVNSTKRKNRKISSRRAINDPPSQSSINNIKQSEIVPRDLQLDLSRITMRDTSFVAKLASKDEADIAEEEIYLKHYFRNNPTSEQTMEDKRREIYEKYCEPDNDYLSRSYKDE